MERIDSILIPEDMTHVNIYYEKGNITVGFSNENGYIKLGDIIVNQNGYCKIVVLRESTDYGFPNLGYQKIGKLNSKRMNYGQSERKISKLIQRYNPLTEKERVLDTVEKETLLKHIEEETRYIWSDKEKRMIKI